MKSLNPRQLPAPESQNPQPSSNPSPAEEISSQNPPENASQPPSIELEHLTSIEIDAGLKTAFDEGAGEAITGGGSAAAVDFLTKDQFFDGVFIPMHNVPGMMLQLDSLSVKSHEMQAARQASDAIYDTAHDTPILHFLIKPGSIWVQRAIVIYAYAAPKARAVSEELRARKATDATPPAA